MPNVAPDDALPLANQAGEQIRLDAVRLLSLHYQAFNSSAGQASDAAPYIDDALYVLYSTEDCIVYFTGVATKTPVGALAGLLIGGERVTTYLPAGSTGFSAIGLTTSGTLFIQRIASYAGMSNINSLENK